MMRAEQYGKCPGFPLFFRACLTSPALPATMCAMKSPSDPASSRRSSPRWVKGILVLVVLIAATVTLLVIPVCQVYRGR